MKGDNRIPPVRTGARDATDPRYDRGDRYSSPRSGSARTRINWVLALLTVPGAAIVMLFALGAVMSTGCWSPMSRSSQPPSPSNWIVS